MSRIHQICLDSDIFCEFQQHQLGTSSKAHRVGYKSATTKWSFFSFNERIFAVCWSVNGQILSVALLSGRGRWSTFFYIFLQQNKTCCNLHSLSGEFSCSLRSSLRYLNDNDMMFQFQKDTMMIKNGAGSESYNIHMLRLSVSIHDTSVNVPQTHEIAESAMRSQLEGDVLPI